MLIRANFLETGILESRWAQEIRRLYEWRISADYRPDITFDRDDANDTCESAVQFLALIQPLLSSIHLEETDGTTH